jgi:hypothetical protein
VSKYLECAVILRRAREISGTSNFGGGACDAIRQAAKERDLDPHPAALWLAKARPPERMLKTVEGQPELQRAAFRRRLCKDFDSALDRLADLGKPSYKQTLGRRAGAEATNWAGQSKSEKDAKWNDVFEKAVDALDKRRAIEKSLRMVTKLTGEAPTSPFADVTGTVPESNG